MNETNTLGGKSFCFATHYHWINTFIDNLRVHGGIYHEEVLPSTDYLVLGGNPRPEFKKLAIEYKTTIISYPDYLIFCFNGIGDAPSNLPGFQGHVNETPLKRIGAACQRRRFNLGKGGDDL